MNGTDCNGSNAKFHVITHGGNSTIFATITDRYSMTQGAIASYYYIGMDEYVAKMINPQSWPNLSIQREANSSYCFNKSKNYPVNVK